MVVADRSWGRSPDRVGPTTGNFKARCIEPLRRWRIDFDGAGELVSRAEMATRLVGAGPAVPVSFQLELTATMPVWDLYKAVEIQGTDIGKVHHEQVMTGTGVLLVGGQHGGEWSLAGCAFRDHSYGSRDVRPFGGDHLLGVYFPESRRSLQALSFWDKTGKVQFRTASIHQGDQIEVIPNMEMTGLELNAVRPTSLRDLTGNPTSFQMMLDTNRGRVVLDGEVLHVINISLIDKNTNVNGSAINIPGDHLLLAESQVRMTWPDGDVGYGFFERCYKEESPADGRQMSLVVYFGEEACREPALVGGKGANLALLTQAELPVPEGFCVTTEAYSAFAQAVNLDRRVGELLGKLEQDAESLETLSAELRRFIETAALPDTVADGIRSAYQRYGSDDYVAVRSSGTAEDLAGASFAGLHDTYLDIRGADAVVAAVMRCWASMWTARAISYRRSKGFDQVAAKIAVVVQRMVEADTAGVMFTANPMSAATDEIVINATWGLGEALVSGIVTPDEHILDRATLVAKEHRVGSKEARVVRNAAGAGTITEAVPEGQRARLALAEPQLRQLGELGQRVTALYKGVPQDIEWAMIGDRALLAAGTSRYRHRTRVGRRPGILAIRARSARYALDPGLGGMKSGTVRSHPLRIRTAATCSPRPRRRARNCVESRRASSPACTSIGRRRLISIPRFMSYSSKTQHCTSFGQGSSIAQAPQPGRGC